MKFRRQLVLIPLIPLALVACHAPVPAAGALRASGPDVPPRRTVVFPEGWRFKAGCARPPVA